MLRRVLSTNCFLYYPCFFSEDSEETDGFFSDRTLVLVFPMVAGRFAVGVLLLVEVETEGQRDLVELGVAVEAGVAGARQDTDETHLAIFFALKSVTGPPKERYRVFWNGANEDFHTAVTDDGYGE